MHDVVGSPDVSGGTDMEGDGSLRPAGGQP